MTRITRITAASLAALAIAAPAATATAMPDRGLVRTSSLAGTTSPPVQQDQRSPDARDASAAPLPAAPAPPAPAPAAGGGDASPLVSILSVAFACLLIAAGMGHAVRASGRVGRARIGA